MLKIIGKLTAHILPKEVRLQQVPNIIRSILLGYLSEIEPANKIAKP